MARLAFGGFQQRHLGFDRLHAGEAALHFQLAAGAEVEARLGQALRFAQADQNAPCHVQPLLRAAQLEVVARHFGGHCHLHRLQVVALRLQVRMRGLGTAAHATEQVQVPGRIEAGRVTVGLHAALAFDGLLGAGAFHAGGHVRRQVPAPFGEHRTRFVHARDCDANIGIGEQRFAHQLVEHRVVELAPPRGDRMVGHVVGRSRVLQRGRCGLRRHVVGAHGDAAGQHHRCDGDDERTDHHGSTWSK